MEIQLTKNDIHELLWFTFSVLTTLGVVIAFLRLVEGCECYPSTTTYFFDMRTSILPLINFTNNHPTKINKFATGDVLTELAIDT